MSFSLHHPNFRQNKFTSTFAIPNLRQSSKSKKKYKSNKNHSNTVKIQYYFTKKYPKRNIPFTPKKCQIGTTNWNYDKALYGQLQIYPNHEIIHHPGWCGWWHLASLIVVLVKHLEYFCWTQEGPAYTWLFIFIRSFIRSFGRSFVS